VKHKARKNKARLKRTLTFVIAGIILLLLLYPVLRIAYVPILSAVLTYTTINYHFSYELPSYSFYVNYFPFFISTVLLLSIILSYFTINSGMGSRSPSHLARRIFGVSFLITGILTILLIMSISFVLAGTSNDPLRTIQEFRTFSDMYLQIAIGLGGIGATLYSDWPVSLRRWLKKRRLL